MDYKQILPSLLIDAVHDGVGGVYHVPEPVSADKTLCELNGIYSSIYLKGDMIGKLSLFIREEDASRVVAFMLGVDEIDEGSSQTLDGIGEIVNMVVGCFKKKLESHKLNFDISIPSTRLTSTIPVSRWENNIEQFFLASKVRFLVSLSYRVATKEDKVAAAKETAPKPKLTAADLLKMALAKKKT